MKRAIATVIESTVRKDLPTLRFGESSDVRLALLEAGFRPGDRVEIVALVEQLCAVVVGRDRSMMSGPGEADELYCGKPLPCAEHPVEAARGGQKLLGEEGVGRGDLLLYWLLRAYRARQREGWESGPTESETFSDILAVLCNIGADPTLDGSTADYVLSQPPVFAPSAPISNNRLRSSLDALAERFKTQAAAQADRADDASRMWGHAAAQVREVLAASDNGIPTSADKEVARLTIELQSAREQLVGAANGPSEKMDKNTRLEKERAEWQESAEAYCDHAGRRFKLLERVHAACGRALAGDHDKPSMLATLKLCAELAASDNGTIRKPAGES